MGDEENDPSLDPFDWDLCLQLHITLEELDRMSNREYASWRAFFKHRKAMQDLAADLEAEKRGQR